jgi:hypothetical protein
MFTKDAQTLHAFFMAAAQQFQAEITFRRHIRQRNGGIVEFVERIA